MACSVWTSLPAYVDDLAVLASALAVTDLEAATARTMDFIRTWMEERGLFLAPHKTEVLMFSGRRVGDLPEIEVGSHRVRLSKDLKYLGVTLDGNLSFSNHVRGVAERASAAAMAVAMLMPNVGGLSVLKRSVLTNVVMSPFLCVAPV